MTTDISERKQDHLLLRVLRMWLVCQLFIHRYEVGKRDLGGQKASK